MKTLTEIQRAVDLHEQKHGVLPQAIITTEKQRRAYIDMVSRLSRIALCGVGYTRFAGVMFNGIRVFTKSEVIEI